VYTFKLIPAVSQSWNRQNKKSLIYRKGGVLLGNLVLNAQSVGCIGTLNSCNSQSKAGNDLQLTALLGSFRSLTGGVNYVDTNKRFGPSHDTI